MSRPKPTILLSYSDGRTLKAEQILEAAAIYAVFYNGQPINFRSVHTLLSSFKYRKTSFSNRAHAHNLSEKLNQLFKCDRFAVYRLTTGEIDNEEK